MAIIKCPKCGNDYLTLISVAQYEDRPVTLIGVAPTPVATAVNFYFLHCPVCQKVFDRNVLYSTNHVAQTERRKIQAAFDKEDSKNIKIESKDFSVDIEKLRVLASELQAELKSLEKSEVDLESEIAQYEKKIDKEIEKMYTSLKKEIEKLSKTKIKESRRLEDESTKENNN